jgi:hypothetical protein
MYTIHSTTPHLPKLEESSPNLALGKSPLLWKINGWTQTPRGRQQPIDITSLRLAEKQNLLIYLVRTI